LRNGLRLDYLVAASKQRLARRREAGSRRGIFRARGWSPEQVSGWLKIQYPDDESMRVSHATISRSLFIQVQGVLKRELIGHLRSKRCILRSQQSRVGGQSRGQIVDAISIRDRPAEIVGPGTGDGKTQDLHGGHECVYFCDPQSRSCARRQTSRYRGYKGGRLVRRKVERKSVAARAAKALSNCPIASRTDSIRSA
jgi:hypothetical protein